MVSLNGLGLTQRRENHDTIVKLKGLTPGGSIPRGMLLSGKASLEQVVCAWLCTKGPLATLRRRLETLIRLGRRTN